MAKTVKLTDVETGAETSLNIRKATEGPNALDISQLAQEMGYFTFDPGFVSTASCESKITYIDGDKGELRYRGYAIEDLAEHSNFIESSYLLYYGELPTAEQYQHFSQDINDKVKMDEKAMTSLLNAFPQGAHPMPMLMASVSYLAALDYDKKDIYNSEYRSVAAHELIAKMSTIAAWVYRSHAGKALIKPTPGLPYIQNFLEMMFGDERKISATYIRALDLILLLHADHEQNASTSTVRLTGSTESSPFAAITAGIASLWGPAHGGANESVIKMLEEIVNSGHPLEDYIARAKDKEDNFRLMGFGHRIYKNYDPRAKIIRQTCHSLLSELGGEVNKPLLDKAMKLEKIALEDEYFIDRKLYPNVDFYSGIILSAMGLSRDMFTVIFALARTVGWLSHWNEMLSDGHPKIYRPRQLYTGEQLRKYKPLQKNATSL